MKLFTLAVFIFAIVGCTSQPQAQSSTATHVGMPNPASVSCIEHGGRIDLRHDAAGNVGGVCVFSDGRECEEWALFRDHRCVAGTPATMSSTNKPAY